MPDMLDDPTAMTLSQHRRQIAAILARGVLRIRKGNENRFGRPHLARPKRIQRRPACDHHAGKCSSAPRMP